MSRYQDLEAVLGTRLDFLEPDERPLVRISPSLRLLASEILVSLAYVVGAFALGAFVLLAVVDLHEPQVRSTALTVATTFLGGLGVVLGLRIASALLEIYITEYVITDRRAYHVRAFIRRHVTVVPFEKMTNLNVRTNLLERAVGIYRLQIVAYGVAGGSILMRGIEGATDILWRISGLARARTNPRSLVFAD